MIPVTDKIYIKVKTFFCYIKKILTARDGNIGNCQPEKTTVDRGEAEVDIDCTRG